MKKIVLVIFSVPLGLLVLVAIISQLAPDKPPEDFLFVHNILDLKQVQSISQFRGCNGHRTMPQYLNEPNSSMTNFVVSNVKSGNASEKLKIFAPFDGYVTHSLTFDGFSIVPKSSEFPWWPFNQWRLFIAFGKTLPQFNGTAPMRAGELIGYSISPTDTSGQRGTPFRVLDFRLGVMAIPPQIKDGNGEPWKKIDTIFHYMTDEVFAEYKAAVPGLETPEDFVIPVSWRIVHPCLYQDNGPFFDPSNVERYINEKYRGAIYFGIKNNPENIQKKLDCWYKNTTEDCDNI